MVAEAVATPSAPMRSRFERRATLVQAVPEPPERVYARLDDHLRLARHMTRRDWRMLGSRLDLSIDPATASEPETIRWRGRIAGMSIHADEVVLERVPHRRKVWATVGPVRLLVIDAYRMGFTIEPVAGGSIVTLEIDFDLPRRARWRWLGWMLGPWYARWCLARMLDEAG